MEPSPIPSLKRMFFFTRPRKKKKSGLAIKAVALFFFLRGLVKKIIRFKLGMGEGPIIFNAYGLLYDSVAT